MFPDAKWLDVLKLPFKAKLAIALACGLLLYLFDASLLSFGKLDNIIKTALVIALAVSAVIVVVDGLAWLAGPIVQRRHSSLLAARRALRRKEEEAQREEQRAAVLAQLDHLSAWEIKVIAKALKSDSPTFYTYVHSPPVTMLLGKRLAWTPGGEHHQDHYPFTIADFVWEELLKRREEFLAKDQAVRDAEEAEKRSGSRHTA